MYKRKIQKKIEDWLFKNKILIIYGARQVGKTTLCKTILQKYKSKYATSYFNCEHPEVQNFLQQGPEIMKQFFGDSNFICLDEAQTVQNIGRIIKIFHDAYPDIQLILTGSSSFELSNTINEPLTGRSLEFILYPISFSEYTESKNPLEKKSILSQTLIYGLYPEICTSSQETKKILLLDLTKKYLYKDIFSFSGIKNHNLVYKILKALAYQLGNEVSIPEIAKLVGSTQPTVEHYINILEKAFIIFRLESFSTNQRKEIRKSKKIFFYDVGIRNALIENFDFLDLRNDRGAVFENFVLLEKKKESSFLCDHSNFFFWRTYDQQEIDIIQKKENKIFAFEVKWQSGKKIKTPIFFQNTYPDAEFSVITLENFFLIDK